MKDAQITNGDRAEILREAAHSGFFGTYAQTTLLRMADGFEAEEEPSNPYWAEAFDDAWSEFEGDRNDVTRDAFTQGWHSRDAEVDELRKQIDGWMARALIVGSGTEAETGDKR